MSMGDIATQREPHQIRLQSITDPATSPLATRYIQQLNGTTTDGLNEVRLPKTLSSGSSRACPWAKVLGRVLDT